MLSAIETWAPRYIAPPRGNRLGTDELADVCVGLDRRGESRFAARLFRPVRRGEFPRLHDQIRKRQVVLPLRERIRELLPPAVLDPFSHDRVAQEQRDLTQLVEKRHGRVDAQE